MKRAISLVLVLMLVLSLFAGCAGEEPTNAPVAPEAPTEAAPAVDTDLENAIAFLKTYYKGAGGDTPKDFQRLGTIRVADKAYEVVYTVDCDESIVKIVKGDDGNVTIDVNEECDNDVPYVLTATITGTDGNTASLSWNHNVPASMSYSDVVDAGYALAEGDSLGYEATLKGVITNIDTPYSADYKNITVTIQVEGREDKPIMCYRLKGEGADQLNVGDTITVTGKMKNYKGTIEFDAGCALDAVEKTGVAIEVPSDPAEIVKAAFELEPGQDLPYEATLTGVIVAFDGGFSEKYGNVTVTIEVEGKNIVCFRMKGEGANSLHINDTITVTGILTNYKGTVEFDAGCKLVEVVDGVPPTGPKDVLKHIDAAYKLLPGCALNYPTKLTGTVVSVDSPYSDTYKNVTVTIVVPGREDKPIQCYRMKGTDAENVGVNDTITVNGWLMNYKGKIEYAASCRLVKWVDAVEPEAPSNPAEIVNAAYALAEGEALPYNATLSGVITEVNTAYSEKYGNVTVTIVVGGMADKPIECFRLKGEGAETIAVGDSITVSGIIKNYKGKVEFDAGCALVAYTKGEAKPEDKPEEEKPEEPTVPATLAEQLAEAAKLEKGSLPYNSTITGTVTNIVKVSDYGNNQWDFYVSDGTNEVRCYFVKFASDVELKVGDSVTVTGPLSAYKGTPQFTKTASATLHVVEEEKPAVPATFAEMVAEAAKLEGSDPLPYTTVQTGVVTNVTYFNEQYNSYSFVLDVNGVSVECYSLGVAEGQTIEAGDTVTVAGALSAFKGKVQFSYKHASITDLVKA